MQITNPRPYLDKIDLKRFEGLLSKPRLSHAATTPPITYVEPGEARERTDRESDATSQGESFPPNTQEALTAAELSGKIQRLGDFVDTDAVRLDMMIPDVAMLTTFPARSGAVPRHVQNR